MNVLDTLGGICNNTPVGMTDLALGIMLSVVAVLAATLTLLPAVLGKLGVSALVAITGGAPGVSALGAFHHAWWAFSVIGLAAGAVLYALSAREA